MSPQPPLVGPASEWLRERFRAYYERHPPPAPDRYGFRELAFCLFGEAGMHRHLALPDPGPFRRLLATEGPRHVYYSTAHYRHPEAPSMQAKDWLGADLVFDLDADHLPGAQRRSLREQLEAVKVQFLRLIDEFLLEDFGFKERDLLLTFSGGRGYHCHVRHEAVFGLSGTERRAIVDYVHGTGLEPRLLLEARGSPPLEPVGWDRRLRRGLTAVIDELGRMPAPEREKHLNGIPGMGNGGLEDIQSTLGLDTNGATASSAADDRRAGDSGFASVVSHLVVPRVGGHVDGPVTADPRRLIRLPGSLHGRTGLLVTRLCRDQIPEFEPLSDAVAFGQEPIRVHVHRPVILEVAGARHDLNVGEAVLPEAVAIMAVARGAASPTDFARR